MECLNAWRKKAATIHNDAIALSFGKYQILQKKDHDRFHLLAKAVMVIVNSHSQTDYLPV